VTLPLDNVLSGIREAGRQAAHRILPKRVRDFGSRALDIISAVRYVGVTGCRRLTAASAEGRSTAMTAFSVRSLAHPIWIRHHQSDVDELVHTVFRKTYGQWLPETAPRWILDLGANIGDTAAWFLSRFPTARLVAVEPDPANYEMALRNLGPYGSRAIVVNAAIWPTDGELVFLAGDRPSGSRVRTAQPGEPTSCTAISISTLMRRYEIPEIDVLKCDIEEAEETLFRENADPWLSKTHHLCIEIHSPAARAAVLDAVARHGFTGRPYRDIDVFRKSARS